MSKFVKTITRQVVAVEVDWKGLANSVDELIMEHHYKMLQEWKDHRNMRAMFMSDAQTGLDACDLLAKGNWKKAKAAIDNMDTAPRDIIYDFIEQVAGEEFFKHV